MSIKGKLYALVSGLLLLTALVTGVGLYGMNDTLQGMSSIYRDRIVPLRDLKEIADAYAVNIVDTTHKVRNGNLSFSEGIAQIDRAEKLIGDKWRGYLATELVADGELHGAVAVGLHVEDLVVEGPRRRIDLQPGEALLLVHSSGTAQGDWAMRKPLPPSATRAAKAWNASGRSRPSARSIA